MKDINSHFVHLLVSFVKLSAIFYSLEVQFFQFNGHFTSTEQRDSPLNIYLTSNPVSARLAAYSRSEGRWFTYVDQVKRALFECSTWMSTCSAYVEKVTWDIRGHEWPHDIWRLCTQSIYIFTSPFVPTFFATEMIESLPVFASLMRSRSENYLYYIINNAVNLGKRDKY